MVMPALAAGRSCCLALGPRSGDQRTRKRRRCWQDDATMPAGRRPADVELKHRPGIDQRAMFGGIGCPVPSRGRHQNLGEDRTPERSSWMRMTTGDGVARVHAADDVEDERDRGVPSILRLASFLLLSSDGSRSAACAWRGPAMPGPRSGWMGAAASLGDSRSGRQPDRLDDQANSPKIPGASAGSFQTSAGTVEHDGKGAITISRTMPGTRRTAGPSGRRAGFSGR